LETDDSFSDLDVVLCTYGGAEYDGDFCQNESLKVDDNKKERKKMSFLEHDGEKSRFFN